MLTRAVGLSTLLQVAWCSSASHTEVRPKVRTSLGVAVGSFTAQGIERYGAVPYALPPLGERRFARAEVSREQWPALGLDATRPGPPCLQNPGGDPRDSLSESPPPSEDCLTLNIWRKTPSNSTQKLQPVMVYLFGGGLCGGYAGNERFDGSQMIRKHNVITVTVQHRLGALGFAVGEDPARPGTGGMNGIYDNVVALQWIQEHIAAFGGDPKDVTLFGQSSGGYSVCTLSVAPAAKGLFQQAAIQSGPCVGGPPGRGWGPGSLALGRNATQMMLQSLGAKTLNDLRSLPAERIQWPEAYMSGPDKAPYFSGYFEDSAVLPASTTELWETGKINPQALIVQFTSKDGTAAFYGTSPQVGKVQPNDAASYKKQQSLVWGPRAAQVLQHYPLKDYPSAAAAFMQADADAFVICPSRQLVRYAARAGRKVWVSEFAHFMPRATNCLGADEGVELHVVPPVHSPDTQLWATHGADVVYVWGNLQKSGSPGFLQKSSSCTMSAEETSLSSDIMAYWSSLARHGNPNVDRAASALEWPQVSVGKDGAVSIHRMRFAVQATDGVPTMVLDGIHDSRCDFWDSVQETKKGRTVSRRHSSPRLSLAVDRV